MIVGSTKEIAPEKRVSITPDTTKSFKDLGLRVLLQKGYVRKYTDISKVDDWYVLAENL